MSQKNSYVKTRTVIVQCTVNSTYYWFSFNMQVRIPKFSAVMLDQQPRATAHGQLSYTFRPDYCIVIGQTDT